MSRLVVVSNRVPSPDSGASPGGLAAGVMAALEEVGGLWFGWSGRVVERPGRRAEVRALNGFALATVDLSPDEHDRYYLGFANRTLWPLLHGRIDLAAFDAADFAAYGRVNETFAQRLVPLLDGDDTVWVHDYHLVPLGRELRRAGVTAPLGFFLHTPLPAPEVLATLPSWEALVRSLCAYDLVGFQSRRDWRNFCDLVERELHGSVSSDGTVSVLGRSFQGGVFPIGIDVERFAAMASSQEAQRLAEGLIRCRGERRWCVGVDRLDYTKGVDKRFRALEALLDAAPEYRHRVSLVQIAAPSRETVPEYVAMRRTLETLAGGINGRIGEFAWVPIHYLNRAFSQASLAMLYRLSRVGLVTPLRDGMNLVAKEYVAAQDPDDPGVLVLSRFTGAAEQLGGALLVNPYDVGALAEALRRALEMPLAERQVRWRLMHAELGRRDVSWWRRSFLDALGRVRRLPAVSAAAG